MLYKYIYLLKADTEAYNDNIKLRLTINKQVRHDNIHIVVTTFSNWNN